MALTQLLAFLAGPWQFELTQRALLQATVVSVACGVVGVLVVLRGLAFISDALAHCVVPGVVVAYLTHASHELAGGAAALLAAFGISALHRRGLLASDTAIAVVFTGAFALGLAMISATRSYFSDLTEILFGAILAVDRTDLFISSIVAILVVSAVIAFYWPFVLVSFDPEAARAQGLPVEQLDLLLFAILSLATVSGLIAVGSTMVTGLLIVPAATARLLARRVATQMVISAMLACLASWIGLYASYYFRFAAGGTIILVAAALFGLALAAKPIWGALRAPRAVRLAPRSSAPRA